MKKKFFAVALATTMTMSTMITASAETLTGTAWWTGSQTGTDYTLSGDGSVSLDVAFKSGDEAGYGAFNVEVYADKWYMTTGSDVNAWWAEGAGTGSEGITGVATTPASTIEAGKTYKVTVTRAGNQLTVTYANPDGSKYAEFVGTNDTTPSDLKVHVMAQVGTYDISESKAAEATTDKKEEGTTEAKKEEGTTEAKKEESTTAKKADATTAAGNGTPKTGDVAPIAALGAVAVVACAGVVVSRKKVTE